MLVDKENRLKNSAVPLPLPICSHTYIYRYCTSTHIFTVLPHMFFSSKKHLYYYMQQNGAEGAILTPFRKLLTTVLSPIKVPSFHTCNYRTSTHGATALSNMVIKKLTVLSPMFRVCNILRSIWNLTYKDVLKDVLKNNISFDDAFFLVLNSRRIGVHV